MWLCNTLFTTPSSEYPRLKQAKAQIHSKLDNDNTEIIIFSIQYPLWHRKCVSASAHMCVLVKWLIEQQAQVYYKPN